MVHRKRSGYAHRLRGLERARHRNVDIFHCDGFEVAGPGVSAQIDQVQQRARALVHEGHFDQRMRVGTELWLRNQAVHNVAEQARVRGQTEPLVEPAKIPGNPGN